MILIALYMTAIVIANLAVAQFGPSVTMDVAPRQQLTLWGNAAA